MLSTRVRTTDGQEVRLGSYEMFTAASRAKLKDTMERRLDKMRLCALLIDATPFAGQQMVAALGIRQDGRRTQSLFPGSVRNPASARFADERSQPRKPNISE